MTVEERTFSRHRAATVLVLVLSAGALAACGSSGGSKSSASSSPASTPATTAASGASLSVSPVEKSEDDLSFTKKHLTAKAGTVTLQNVNTGTQSHGIAIEGNGVDKDGPIVAPGKTASVTLKLKPGTYTFYCPVPEHEKYGMKGTLTVT